MIVFTMLILSFFAHGENITSQSKVTELNTSQGFYEGIYLTSMEELRKVKVARVADKDEYYTYLQEGKSFDSKVKIDASKAYCRMNFKLKKGIPENDKEYDCKNPKKDKVEYCNSNEIQLSLNDGLAPVGFHSYGYVGEAYLPDKVIESKTADGIQTIINFKRKSFKSVQLWKVDEDENTTNIEESPYEITNAMYMVCQSPKSLTFQSLEKTTGLLPMQRVLDFLENNNAQIIPGLKESYPCE